MARGWFALVGGGFDGLRSVIPAPPRGKTLVQSRDFPHAGQHFTACCVRAAATAYRERLRNERSEGTPFHPRATGPLIVSISPGCSSRPCFMRLL